MTETNMEIGTADGLSARERILGLVSALNLQEGDQLPSERELVSRLGLSRRALRQGFEVLEAEGRLWRSVGKGTFLGQRPVVTSTDIAAVGRLTNPLEIMQTRLILEPPLASLAALRASTEQIDRLRIAVEKSRSLQTYDAYELWDERFHSAVAHASGHRLLQALYATVTKLRSETSWGNLRRSALTSDRIRSFGETHSEILAAIEARDANRAGQSMRAHLSEVLDTLFKGPLGTLTF